jgi:hypothetical protein
MGIEISIPEELVHQRVDQVVGHKLRHEKVVGILSDITKPMVVETMGKVQVYLEEKLSERLSTDLMVQRDCIIESYLESKRSNIFLNNQLVASIDATAHKETTNLVKYLQLFGQAMIVGPTGSGKSTMAKQAADSMNLRFGSFSCNMEASKSELIGFQNLNGYVESNFLNFYENGGVFLIDEYDAMSASISVVLNAAFDRSGQIAVPNRQGNPVAKKHKDFYCILAGNTWGSGSIEYQGRDMQDAAFLDRFKMCRIYVDYDQNVEKNIAGDHYPWLLKVRQFVNDHLDNEKFSTRSVYDATLLLKNGYQKRDVLKMLSSHWEQAISEKLLSQFK